MCLEVLIMFKRMKTGILLLLLPTVLLIISLGLFLTIRNEAIILNKELNDRMMMIQNEEIAYINGEIKDSLGIATDLSSFVNSSLQKVSLNVYEDTMASLIKIYPKINGMGIWFEPYAYNSNINFFAINISLVGNVIKTNYINDSNRTYNINQDTYKIAIKTNSNAFTKPRYDAVTNNYYITCFTPFYNDEQELIGCTSIEFTLTNIMRNFIETYYEEENICYILDDTGTYIASKDDSLIKNQVSIFDTSNPSYLSAIKKMYQNQIGYVMFEKEGKPYRLYYTNVTDQNWKLVTEVSEASITTSSHRLIINFTIIGILISLIILLIIYFVMTIKFEKPIYILLDEFKKIANHTYSIEIPKEMSKRKDEIGLIGSSLGTMKEQLKNYQMDLETMAEENYAFGEELKEQNDQLIKQEETIRKTLTYTNTILNTMPDLVLILGRDGLIHDCVGNTAMLLHPKDNLIGTKVVDLPYLPLQQATLTMENIEKTFQTGESQLCEIIFELETFNEYYELRTSHFIEDKLIIIGRNITSAYQKEEQIKYLNNHDQLTGLPNRKFSDELLIKLFTEKSYPISIIFANINGLKLMNASFGYSAGDQQIMDFADVIRESSINIDYVSRYDGDLFVFYLPYTDKQETHDLVERLKEQCKTKQNHGIQLSISCGYGTIYSDKDSIKDILNHIQDMVEQNRQFEEPNRREKTIDLIVSTLQEKNPREKNHSNRVAHLCKEIAKKLGLSHSVKERIYTAGLLHDIGKIGIPDHVLNKTSTLSDEEYASIRQHPEIGYRILTSAGNMNDIAEFAYTHHERWDGKGYPRGLKEQEIPLEARIIAIADTYDAMTSDRSYRKGMSKEIAIQEMLRCAGTQFESRLVDVFVNQVLTTES